MSTFDFYVAYSAVTGEHFPDVYIPTVEHDDVHDVLIDGVPARPLSHQLEGWLALTGHTGQHGYNGAVMHSSETADDDTIREWVRDAGGDVFAIVEVSAHDDADPVFPDEPDYCEAYGCAHEPAGWTVLYRSA